MVDSLSKTVNHPLGHHYPLGLSHLRQPLGVNSLAILDLSAFFPNGLPDLEYSSSQDSNQNLESPQRSIPINNYDSVVADNIQRKLDTVDPNRNLEVKPDHLIRHEEDISLSNPLSSTIQGDHSSDVVGLGIVEALSNNSDLISIEINTSGQDKVSLKENNLYLRQASINELEYLTLQTNNAISKPDLAPKISSPIELSNNTDHFLSKTESGLVEAIQQPTGFNLFDALSLSMEGKQSNLQATNLQLVPEDVLYQETIFSQNYMSDKDPNNASQHDIHSNNRSDLLFADSPIENIFLSSQKTISFSENGDPSLLDLSYLTTYEASIAHSSSEYIPSIKPIQKKIDCHSQDFLVNNQSEHGKKDIYQSSLNSNFPESTEKLKNNNFNQQYLAPNSDSNPNSKLGLEFYSFVPELTQNKLEFQSLNLPISTPISFIYQSLPKANLTAIENLQREVDVKPVQPIYSSLSFLLGSFKDHANNPFPSETSSRRSNLPHTSERLEGLKLDPFYNNKNLNHEVSSLLEKDLPYNSIQLKASLLSDNPIQEVLAREDGFEAKQAMQKIGYYYQPELSLTESIVPFQISESIQVGDSISRQSIGCNRQPFSTSSNINQISNLFQSQGGLNYLNKSLIKPISNTLSDRLVDLSYISHNPEYPNTSFLQEKHQDKIKKQKNNISFLENKNSIEFSSPINFHIEALGLTQLDNGSNLSKEPIPLGANNISYDNTFLEQTTLLRSEEKSYISNQANAIEETDNSEFEYLSRAYQDLLNNFDIDFLQHQDLDNQDNLKLSNRTDAKIPKVPIDTSLKVMESLQRVSSPVQSYAKEILSIQLASSINDYDTADKFLVEPNLNLTNLVLRKQENILEPSRSLVRSLLSIESTSPDFLIKPDIQKIKLNLTQDDSQSDEPETFLIKDEMTRSLTGNTLVENNLIQSDTVEQVNERSQQYSTTTENISPIFSKETTNVSLDALVNIQQEIIEPFHSQLPIPLGDGSEIIDTVSYEPSSSMEQYQDNSVHSSKLPSSLVNHLNNDQLLDEPSARTESDVLQKHISNIQLQSSKDTVDLENTIISTSSDGELSSDDKKNNVFDVIKSQESMVDLGIHQLDYQGIESSFIELNKIQSSFESQDNLIALESKTSYDNNFSFQEPLTENYNIDQDQLFPQDDDALFLRENTRDPSNKNSSDVIELPLLIDTSSSSYSHQSSLNPSKDIQRFSNPQNSDLSSSHKKEDLKVSDDPNQGFENVNNNSAELASQDLLLPTPEKYLSSDHSFPLEESDSIRYSQERLNINQSEKSDLSEEKMSDRSDFLIDRKMESLGKYYDHNILASSQENNLETPKDLDISNIPSQLIQFPVFQKPSDFSTSQPDFSITQNIDPIASLDKAERLSPESSISTEFNSNSKQLQSPLPIIFNLDFPEDLDISKIENYGAIQRVRISSHSENLKLPQISNEENLFLPQSIQSESILEYEEFYQPKLFSSAQDLDANKATEEINLNNINLIRSEQVSDKHSTNNLSNSLELLWPLDANFNIARMSNLVNQVPENNLEAQKHISSIRSTYIQPSSHLSDDIRTYTNLNPDNSLVSSEYQYLDYPKRGHDLSTDIVSTQPVTLKSLSDISLDTNLTSVTQLNPLVLPLDFDNSQSPLILPYLFSTLELSSPMDQDLSRSSSNSIIQKNKDVILPFSLNKEFNYEPSTDLLNALDRTTNLDIDQPSEKELSSPEVVSIIQRFNERQIDILSNPIDLLSYPDINSDVLLLSSQASTGLNYLSKNQESSDDSDRQLESNQFSSEENYQPEPRFKSNNSWISPKLLFKDPLGNSEIPSQPLTPLFSKALGFLEHETISQISSIDRGDVNLSKSLSLELLSNSVYHEPQSFLPLPNLSLDSNSNLMISHTLSDQPRSESLEKNKEMHRPILSPFLQGKLDSNHLNVLSNLVEVSDNQDHLKDSEMSLPMINSNLRPLNIIPALIDRIEDKTIPIDKNDSIAIQQKKDIQSDLLTTTISPSLSEEIHSLPELGSVQLKLPVEDHLNSYPPKDVAYHSSTLGVLQPITVLQSIMAKPIQSQGDTSLPEEIDQQAHSSSLHWPTIDNTDSIDSSTEHKPTLLLPTQWTSLTDLMDLPLVQPLEVSPGAHSQSTPNLQAISEVSPLLPSTPLLEPIQALQSQAHSQFPGPSHQKLSVSRRLSLPKLEHHNHLQAKLSTPVSSFPEGLIKADEDTPFTSITAESDATIDTQAIEHLAQEIYYLLRQRLVVDQERRGQVYPKRFK